MSSYDEVLSAYLLYTKKSLGGIFKDQIEWIENVIKNFKNKNEYFIIFRPHPREFLKTNDSIYLRKLKKFFQIYLQICVLITQKIKFQFII